MSENKITSFDNWRDRQDEERGYLTVAMRENQKKAWNACAKMKDEEIEKLMVLQTELEAKNYDLQKENDELKLQNRKAINAFKALNRYLCNKVVFIPVLFFIR